MTEAEIIEGNHLIAVLMGARMQSPSTKYSFFQYPLDVSTSSPFQHKETYKQKLHSKELEYHSSWNWLMPVVEKISRIEYERYEQEADVFGTKPTTVIVTAYPRTFGMISHDGKPMFRYNRCQLFIADTLIEAAWEATVDFIKFQNQESQQK